MGYLIEKTSKNLHTVHPESPDLLTLFSGSEILYQDLFDNASDAIFIRDLYHNIVEANKAAARITGYSRNDLLKMNGSELLTERSFNLAMRRQRAHLKNQTFSQRYELEFVRKDGSIRNTESVTSLISFNGQPIGIQAIVRDITERKRAEEEIKEARDNYLAITNLTGDIIVTVDTKGKWTFLNDGACQFWGKPREALMGSTFTGYLHPDDQAETMAAIKRLQSGEKVKVMVNRQLTPDGWRTIEWNGAGIFNQKGRFVGFQATGRDITERRRTEESLRLQSEIAANMAEGVYLVGLNDLIIRYTNPKFEEMFGYEPGEMTGKYASIVNAPTDKSPEESAREIMEVIFRTGEWHGEVNNIKKDGTLFWCYANVSVFEHPEFGKVLVAVHTDITEQKRLKDNMAFYISGITKAQEEERKRIARELHDEPVQSLAALAYKIDALAGKKETMPEDALQSLEELRANTNIVLNQLRGFIHQLRPGVLDQVGLVAALELLAEELGKEAQINTSLRVMGLERRLAPETEIALFRVAQEALNNVRWHSGVKKTSIRILFSQSKVCLTVSDSGCGFEIPEALGNLATEGKLGLLGMQERARLLDGKFSVKSQVGKGTIVRIECAV